LPESQLLMFATVVAQMHSLRTGQVEMALATSIYTFQLVWVIPHYLAPAAAAAAAVVEVTDGSGHDAPFIGVAALDTAAGQVLLGSWRDDEVRQQQQQPAL
jgi:hypothetical protein